MKNYLLPLLFSLFTLGTITTYSQNIGFDYDAAGNRISRYVIVLKSTETGSSNNNGKQQEYGETINNVAVKILPNPNGGKFAVNINGKTDGKTVKLYLFDISGKAIYKNEPFKKNYHEKSYIYT